MSLESAVYAVLGADAALTALVGTRIWPVGEEGRIASPYVSWERVSTTPLNYLEQSGGAPERARLQFNCWAETSEAAIAVAAALRAALLAATSVTAVWLDEQSLFELDGRRRGRAVDFSVWHQS